MAKMQITALSSLIGELKAIDLQASRIQAD
jgi:hypothetical protein